MKSSGVLLFCIFDSHPITNTGFGVDVGWPCGVKLDLAAQVADVDPQQVHFAFVGGPPNLPKQMLMRKHLASILKQQL